MEVNFDDFKCRCSAISKMMANSKSNPQITEKQAETLREYRMKLNAGLKITPKQAEELVVLEEKEKNSNKVFLSDTCISYLMEWYAWETEGMISVGKEAFESLAMRKGKEAETEALQLLSIVAGDIFQVHKERIYNDYLSGEIDCYLGESVYEAIEVDDIKNAFDYPAFLKKINNGLENGQQEQLQGYGDITGAKKLFIANTLVDNSPELMLEMQYRISKKMNVISTESPEFLEEWAKWERSMRFTKIPIHKRVYRIPVEPFTEFERQKVYDRVKVCREWLNNFHERYQNLNLQ